ncbi:MAG: hypothetical protein HY814_11375 [Candidatus Riflebacteria bacterium]|nr:hypothetical protein [Candidatus Riflebacteria bacterium]
MKARRSNVTLRSNVAPIESGYERPFEDPAFRARIRGRAALEKLAEALYGPTSDKRVWRRHLDRNLTDDQKADWDEGPECFYCHEIPAGLVQRPDGTRVVEFRCPRAECRRKNG